MSFLLRIPALVKTVQTDMLVMHRSSHLERDLLKTVGAVHLEAGGEWQINHPWMASQESVTVSVDERR